MNETKYQQDYIKDKIGQNIFYKFIELMCYYCRRGRVLFLLSDWPSVIGLFLVMIYITANLYAYNYTIPLVDSAYSALLGRTRLLTGMMLGDRSSYINLSLI